MVASHVLYLFLAEHLHGKCPKLPIRFRYDGLLSTHHAKLGTFKPGWTQFVLCYPFRVLVVENRLFRKKVIVSSEIEVVQGIDQYFVLEYYGIARWLLLPYCLMNPEDPCYHLLTSLWFFTAISTLPLDWGHATEDSLYFTHHVFRNC